MTTPLFTLPAPDDSVNIKDFTLKRKHIRFRIDNDVFTAHAVLSLPLMQNMVRISKDISKLMSDNKFDAIFEIFDQLLVPESAARFRERALSIGEDAIDMREQIVPILHYLMEEYGIRPTQPSSGSLTGLPSETDGTALTDGSSQTA